MSRLWRGATGAREARQREALLRDSLMQNLSDSVKGIQYQQPSAGAAHKPVPADLATSLCSALEAIFLHGLKDTFFRKARSALTGDPDQRPQPSFWALLLVLSHRDNIKHITSLSLISTEVGQCRAWIRIALNDCLISSYLSTMMRNMNASKPYYAHTAYIRDSDLLDVTQRLLEGVESCNPQLELNMNSSLLNSWSEEVLMLSGVWMPTMKTCPVVPGEDVASMLIEPEIPIPNSSNRIQSVTGIGPMLAMDPDEAINYILSNTPEDFMDEINRNKANTSNTPNSSNVIDVATDNDGDERSQSENAGNSDNTEFVGEIIRPDYSAMGNSLSGKTAWSTDQNEISTSSNSLESHKSKSSISLTDESGSGTFVKTPNLREVVNDLHKELKLVIDEQETKSTDEPTAQPPSPEDPLLVGLGFEVVSKCPSTLFESKELQKLMSHVGALSREYGLDSQDYQCIACKDMLGTTLSKARVCAFSGQYFCLSCMDPNVFMIPARVVHNWDFHRYPVSKRAGMFLLEFQHQPLINLKKFNPLIYTGVAEMAQLQILRIQLNFLKAYLFTCREPIIEELQKRVWPREYLYEHVHMYSISDLAQISNGSLASQLQKIVSFAQSHVKDCWLCSQKGFICEVCNNPKILYPFDIHTTYRCGDCSSVFHAKCLNSKKPCPKCKRKKERQNKSLIDAVHNNF